ncbi:MAG: hypothetical protein OJF61_001950 [Rhodanobacteraceae bacterium]|jgi:excisionase family DNA binding protein|nr:MAG: hypothetical protein OJF61_001950 [Rhodanobacteraceae bacterium]
MNQPGNSLPAPISVSPEDAAQMLGLGRTKTFELIRTRELPSIKIGRRTLVPVAGLHALIERHTAEQAAV